MKKNNLLGHKRPIRKLLWIINLAIFLLVSGNLSSNGANELSWKSGKLEGGSNESLLQQKKQITGKVADEKGMPIIGANVVETGTTNGTVSDARGNFTLNVENGATIHISFIGYLSQVIDASSNNQFNVTLVEDTQTLDDVVVTALGIKREAKALTYSTQQVKGDEISIAKDPSGSLMNTLQGKVAGLQVTQAASGVGAGNRVILRGNRSLRGNNQAMFVVDGVIGGGNLNPDDIESINVLKGASAAALYGSSAANGVIIVTTKSGKIGAPKVTFDSGTTFSNPMVMADFQNEYGQGNGGTFDRLSEQSWGAKMDGQIVKDWKGNDTPFSPQPNNVTDLLQTGSSYINTVAVTAGNEKLQTYLSVTNNIANGMVPNNKFLRNQLNLKTTVQATKRLNVESRITFSQSNTDNPVSTDEDQGAILYSLFKLPRNIRTSDIEDYETINEYGERIQNYWKPGSAIQNNPYFTMNRREYMYDNTGFNTYLKLQYDLTDWLQAKLTYSYGRGFSKNKIKLYAGSYLYKNNLNGQKTGTYYYDEGDSRSQILDFMLSGKNNLIDDLSISYNVGSQYSHNQGNSSSISGQLMYPELFYSGNISSPAVGEGFSQNKLMGLFATATINFRDLLYVDLTGRNDWSSTLPVESRSYFYPSVGVTGIITEMLSLPSWVSFGKIRMAYSMVGNDPGPYNTAQTFTVSTGGRNGYMRPGSTLITPLKPELTKAYELGLDWRFLDSRLGMDVTLYKSNTVNQLISVAHPRASGYGSRFVNVGDVENKGLEIVLKGDIIRNASMTWESTLNLAVNKNKILEIDPKSPKQTLSSPWNYSVVAWEDGSVGDMYTRSFLRDSTNHILIDDKGFPLVEKSNNTYIGNYNPKMTLGWNNRFDYKNFFTSFLIDGRFGGIVASPGDAILAADGSVKVTLPYREGGWIWPGNRNSDKAANTVAIKSEDFWSRFGGRYPQNGELFVYDATNFRLRELIVGYNFNFGSVIESARVSLTARNLFFIYRGSSTFDVPGIGKRKMNFDPDLTSNTGNGQGIVLNLLPSSRSFGVNINLTF